MKHRMPDFNISPVVVRSVIFIFVVNVAISSLFYFSGSGGDFMQIIRRTTAIYGILGSIYAFHMTWPHGKAISAVLLVTFVSACFLEISISQGHVLQQHELLFLIGFPVVPTVWTVLDGVSGDRPEKVNVIEMTIIVIIAWIYFIATDASGRLSGDLTYFYAFVSANSLAILSIYAASPVLVTMHNESTGSDE